MGQIRPGANLRLALLLAALALAFYFAVLLLHG